MSLIDRTSIEAILFDVDETLFARRRAQKLVLQQLRLRLPQLFGTASNGDLERAWAASDKETENHVVSSSDLPATRDIRSQIFLRHLGIDTDGGPGTDAVTAVTQAYLDLYAVVESPVEDAVLVVERCRQRYRVGVVSNAYPDVQYRKLETLGLRQAFACIVLSEEFGARKPDAAIFHEGCRQLQVEPERCLYVGDSYANDVIGATAAGLPCCWLNPEALTATAPAVATVEIARLSELLGWLDL